jgi:hypothetical protein
MAQPAKTQPSPFDAAVMQPPPFDAEPRTRIHIQDQSIPAFSKVCAPFEGASSADAG